MTQQQFIWMTVAGALILFWLAFALLGPRKVDAAGTIVVMRYGRVLSLVALIVALSPPTLLGTLVWRLTWRDEQTLAIVGGSFIALSLLAGVLLVEVVRVCVVLTADGVTRHSPWTGSVTVRWSDVKSVRWSPLNRWFVIRTDSATIRVSQYLTGQNELRQAIMENVAAVHEPEA